MSSGTKHDLMDHTDQQRPVAKAEYEYATHKQLRSRLSMSAAMLRRRLPLRRGSGTPVWSLDRRSSQVENLSFPYITRRIGELAISQDRVRPGAPFNSYTVRGSKVQEPLSQLRASHPLHHTAPLRTFPFPLIAFTTLVCISSMSGRQSSRKVSKLRFINNNK